MHLDNIHLDNKTEITIWLDTVKYFLFVGIQFSLFSWVALPTNLSSHE